MIDPGTAMLIGGGISGIGSLFSDPNKGVKEQKREFNISQAPGLARQIQGAPLRDKLMAIMGNVAGNAPQQFRPNDLYNPQGSQLGGRDPSTLQTPAGYHDGSGPMQALLQQILKSMGYSQFSPQQPSAPMPAPGQGIGMQPGPTPQTSRLPSNIFGGGTVIGTPYRPAGSR